MNRFAPITALITIVLLTTSPVSQSQEDTHQAAIEELLEAMMMPQTLESSIGLMSEMAMGTTPQLQPYEDTLNEFYGKVMSWEAVGPQFVALYKETFTEAEARAFTEFLNTPTGQKFAESQDKLMRRGAAIGEQAVIQNQGLLMDMLRRDGAPF